MHPHYQFTLFITIKIKIIPWKKKSQFDYLQVGKAYPNSESVTHALPFVPLCKNHFPGCTMIVPHVMILAISLIITLLPSLSGHFQVSQYLSPSAVGPLLTTASYSKFSWFPWLLYSLGFFMDFLYKKL